MSGKNFLIVALKLMLSLEVVCYGQISEAMYDITRNESTGTCSCLGDTLTFECTATKELGTVWRGTAFDCSGGNELLLYERDYNSTFPMIYTCNGGMISGQVVSVGLKNYTSQLSITLSSQLFEKTVECVINDGMRITVMSNTTIDATIFPYPPSEKISLSLIDLGMKTVTFIWSPVALGCPAIHYNVLASNCGSCPTTTNDTTITCTDISTRSMLVCSFAVQTVVCGNITGNVSQSEPLIFNITETLIMNEMTSSNKVNTTSISIFLIGVSALLTSIMIVILTCCWLYKRNAIKTSSRFNNTAIVNNDSGDSSLSLQTHATSQENKAIYEYSQLVETPVNLKGLLEKLQGRVSKQWYQLGLTLGLPMDVLEGFNLYSEDDCLAEVLDYWLKHHPGKPTWQEITDAQKKVEMFNTEQNTGMTDKKAATMSDIPPPKPPRRTSSVIMKKPDISPTAAATDDPGHEYDVVH